MKTIIRYYLINLGSLWLAAYLIPGFIYDGGTGTLLKAALVFTGINLILVPVLKILLLPLNLLTLGFFSWAANVLALFALIKLVPTLHVTSFYFSGYSIGGFIIPASEISAFWTAIISSLIIGLITHFFHWLTH